MNIPFKKSFRLERKVERDDGRSTICASQDAFTGRDVKFLLIIFQRAVRIAKTGFDAGRIGPPTHHFRTERQIFQRVDPPEKIPSQERFRHAGAAYCRDLSHCVAHLLAGDRYRERFDQVDHIPGGGDIRVRAPFRKRPSS